LFVNQTVVRFSFVPGGVAKPSRFLHYNR